MTAHELLADLCRRGFHLTPLPGGKLEVRPFSKLPEALREAIRQRKAEVLALLSQQSPFPCPACKGAVRLEPAVPEELPTRIWTCVQCGAWGGTRDGAAYP